MTAPASQLPQPDPLEGIYIQGEQLLAAGRIQEAANLCQQLLEKNPNYGRGYFLLSRIYYHTGNLDKAIEFVDHAIRLMPEKDGMMHYMRGNYFLTKGRFDEAENDMKLAVELEPGFGLASLLLAVVYIHQKKHTEALKHLENAKKLGLEADALHQEGIILTAENRKDEAIESFSKAIRLNGNHVLSYIRRGELALTMDLPHIAAEDAQKVIALNPGHFGGWRLSALVAAHNKDHLTSIQALENALRIKPHSIDLLRMLGLQLQLAGNAEKSIGTYQKVLELDPQDVYSLNALPALLMVTGKTLEAQLYLEKALLNFPDNPVLNHFKAFFDKSQNIPRASDAYVQNVFDNYANDYDAHLKTILHYKTPDLIADGLKRVLAAENNTGTRFSLLDLGCGTGFGAMALEGITARRVGVDLSGKMVEKARTRQLYDELEVAEIKSYLDRTNETFDVIASVDVFVYIGDLAPTFHAVKKALNPEGKFAFSVEESDTAEDFKIRESGRFAHSRHYLEKLAAECGYKIDLLEQALIRHEAGKPLSGLIAVFSNLRIWLFSIMYQGMEII